MYIRLLKTLFTHIAFGDQVVRLGQEINITSTNLDMEMTMTDVKWNPDTTMISVTSDQQGVLTATWNHRRPRKKFLTKISDWRIAMLEGNPDIVKFSADSEATQERGQLKTLEMY